MLLEGDVLSVVGDFKSQLRYENFSLFVWPGRW